MTVAFDVLRERFIQGDLPLIYAEIDAGLQAWRFNAFTRRLVGITQEPMPFRELVVDFSERLDPFSLAQTPERVHLLSISATGHAPMGFLCSFWPAGDQVVLIGAADISEQLSVQNQILMLNRQLNALTRDLHQKNAELAHSNTLKNQFLGMAAHDLRNPLGGIMSYGEFLREEAAPILSSEHREFLDDILKASRTMLRIVEDFLDVSKIESGHLEINPEHVDFSRTLHRTLAMVRPKAARKGVPLQVDAHENLPMLHIDAGKIEQVLANLVSNAIEHSYPNAPVTIRTGLQDSLFHCAVIDQGVGIDAEHIPRLFNPFEKKISQKTGGEPSTGLGLIISKKVVEAHGGRISVTSEKGQGTTFAFVLPVNPGNTADDQG
ncbi:sensor histidine kinase [Thiorhodovibrio frisius]|uniref:histidine kinase n=1 Tax=Thiorhodovibrio frisius TaxID=631362 RepID=H8Z7D8_9GAMM|nr:HAMP domain-containing sensor histidine kinase [Thiorhodovibrio frisius]EIC19854.1 signal transduction histidine kinase [Thiorhodovibrio frisius]WPL20582.1 Non-motile and phage-resistance protein [Thiorhodovibrio frisius]